MSTSKLGRALALGVLPIAALAACGGSSQSGGANADNATKAATTYAEACKRAASEGPLNWWTQDPGTAQKTIKWFNQKYPKIKVNFTQLLENDISQRIVAETNAHRQVSGDLVVSHLAALQPLLQRHLVNTSVKWPTEVDSSLISSGMVRISRRAYGLVYNTQKVKAGDLPTTWDGLADPKYRGKVSVHATGVPFDILAADWGLDRTVAWAHKMVDTVKPAVINGTTASIQAAASGEVPIAASGRDAEMKEQRAAGAPVAIKYLDTVPVLDYFQAIPAGAKHVNAAICFGTWYMQDATPKLEKLTFTANKDTPAGLPAGSKLVQATSAKQVDLSAQAAQQVSQIWANGG